MRAARLDAGVAEAYAHHSVSVTCLSHGHGEKQKRRRAQVARRVPIYVYNIIYN